MYMIYYLYNKLIISILIYLLNTIFFLADSTDNSIFVPLNLLR